MYTLLFFENWTARLADVSWRYTFFENWTARLADVSWRLIIFKFCSDLFAPITLTNIFSVRTASLTTTSFLNLGFLYAAFSLFLRTELGVSGLYFFSDGSQNFFYRAVTAHGLGMVFLFVMPGLISALGNLALPQALGILDFATPRLNNLAF